MGSAGRPSILTVIFSPDRSLASMTTKKKNQALLVDDHPDLLQVVSREIESEGWEVISAGSAQEALEKLKNAAPRVILLDMYMPGINGFELASHLKSDPYHCHIPIVAMTASGLPSERERCLRAGCDDWLAKPFQLRELKRLLADYSESK